MRTIMDDLMRMHDMMAADAVCRPAKAGKCDYRRPLTDMYETETEFVTQIEMPGLEKEDIKVNVTSDGMEIKASRKYEKKDKGYMRYERGYSNFFRRIPFPKEADMTNIQAEYKDGVLELKIPKQEKQEHKQIEIK